MRILVTGVCGFAGSHLADHLLAEGDEVVGVALPGEPRHNLQHLGDRVAVVEADLTDAAAVHHALRELRPEAVCHLAGAASVGQAWGSVAETLRVNAFPLVNLVGGGQATGAPVILVVGSGELYGLVAETRQPISEDEPLRPTNPYALSKLWQEEAARFFAAVHHYPLVITRPFNHTGPRQARHFVCSDFAAQLAEIETGVREPVLRVGNLEARRDFLDVRDVARAYRLALLKGEHGAPYNIASGRAVSIRQVLDILLGMCRVPVEVRAEPERLRPVDTPLLAGDAGRFREATGWAPTRRLAQTLADLLDDWRRRVARERAC